MKRIAFGIFTWAATERRSQRYGYFYPDYTNWAENMLQQVKPEIDLEGMSPLLGQRVRITVNVLEARESGHAGDRAIGIFPSMPEAGQIIDIGVGVLDLLQLDYWTPCGWAIGLQPGDGREEYWIDPAILYRLHDQTVEIYAEVTTDDFSPVPTVDRKVKTGVIDNGDGTIQYVGPPAPQGLRVLPNFTPLGDGMFSVEPPKEGEVFEVLLINEEPRLESTHDSLTRMGMTIIDSILDDAHKRPRAEIPNRGPIAAADFLPAPSTVNTEKDHFWNAFGNSETEVSAQWLCLLAQQNGDWRPFTLQDIQSLYRKTHKSPFGFNQLIDRGVAYSSRGRYLTGGGWIVPQGDLFLFTEEFVLRCYFSSNEMKAQLADRFPEDAEPRQYY